MIIPQKHSIKRRLYVYAQLHSICTDRGKNRKGEGEIERGRERSVPYSIAQPHIWTDDSSNPLPVLEAKENLPTALWFPEFR